MRIVISRQSLQIFQSLMNEPAAAPFVLKVLRAIAQDPTRHGRAFHAAAPPSGKTRIDVAALSGDRQLWLLWNPGIDPIEVLLVVHLPAPRP